MARHVPRIYIENLSDNIFEIPQKQFYHLFSVLRFSTGQEFISFNKIDGEWLCSVLDVGKKSASGKKLKLLRDFSKSPALYLAFCSIKNDNAKLIIEKGTELEVTKFYPLISQYSNSKLNIEKLTTIAVAASEQSERIDIPIINSPLNMLNFLENLPPKVAWFSCIERESQFSYLELQNKHCGFIIGPEGGFSESEKERLKLKTTPFPLSKNILKSETAAIACLSVYNFFNYSQTYLSSS